MSSLSTTVPILAPIGIHGNSTFINFEFSFFTLPMLLIFLPMLYIPITLIIILRILVKLYRLIKDRMGNVQIFSVILISQFMVRTFSIRRNWKIRNNCNKFPVSSFLHRWLFQHSSPINWNIYEMVCKCRSKYVPNFHLHSHLSY